MIPPRRILVGVDFSLASRTALALASVIAGRAGAELHVLHALDPALAAAADTLGSGLIARRYRDLERITAAVCPGERRRVLHVVVGEAASVIRDIAVREQVDLTVCGVRGRRSTATGLCGVTASELIRTLPLPAMFVPEDWCPPGTRAEAVRLGPVVAAVDEGLPSMVAAQAAAALAGMLGTALEVVHAGEPTPALPMPAPIHVLQGEPAMAIAEASGHVPGTSPILVMGRRTCGDATRQRGATVAQVVAASHAPVLMYLAADDSEPQERASRE